MLNNLERYDRIVDYFEMLDEKENLKEFIYRASREPIATVLREYEIIQIGRELGERDL